MSEVKDFIQGGGTLAPQVDANTQAIAAKYGSNFIVNGCGEVQQRGPDSVTGVVTGAFPVDCWYTGNSANLYAVNFTRVSGNYPLPSIQSSLKYTITSARTPAASDYLMSEHFTESGVISALIAKEFTLSFWVKSNKIGQRVCAIASPNLDYSYVATFSITAADTWEFKQIVISGGLPSNISWKNNTTPVRGFTLRFPMSVGATYETTTPNTWVNSNKFWATGTVDLAAQANNYLEFTGVKIELGNQATNYVVNVPEELLKCKRRFEKLSLRGITGGKTSSLCYIGSSWVISPKVLPVPSVTFISDGQVNKVNLETVGLCSLSIGGFFVPTFNALHLDANVATPSTAGNWWKVDEIILDCSI